MTELLATGDPEQAVIGCMLLDPRAIRTAAETVTGADFMDMNRGLVFDGILAMLREGVYADPMTVAERLPSWGVRGVGAVELHTWTSIPSSWVAVGDYADTVRRESMRRGIEAAAIHLRAGADKIDLATTIHHGIAELRDLVESHAVRKLEAVPLRKILEGTVDYEWVIPGLLEKRDRVIVTGIEGGGKTTLVRQLAVASAAGIHPFAFEPIDPVKVLVIDAENSEVQWRRQVQRLVNVAVGRGRTNPLDSVMIRCTPRLDLTREQDLGQVQQLVERHEPEILFIGPMYRLVPRAINSDDDAAPLLASLDTLREGGAALVIEAHAGHAVGYGGLRDLRPRGSAALMGWPEFGLGLRAAHPDSGRPADEVDVVHWRGARDERAWPDVLFRGSAWPWMAKGEFE